jgi:hypothetical protein
MNIYIHKTAFLLGVMVIALLSSCETHNSTVNDGLPQGTPVVGKNGFVTSPHAPYAGFIDVRGLPAGSIADCPYTGQPFKIPKNGHEELRQVQAEIKQLRQQIAQADSNSTSIGDESNVHRSPQKTSSNIYDEIDRLQSIRNPNDRIRANTDFVKGLMRSFDQTIQNNPQATGGMSPDEFTLEALYNSAREKGLPPSEAQIEAQRQFRNMKRFMNQ